jgi:hypothetical protein
MNKETFNRELAYQARIAVAKTMLRLGAITEEEYCRIDTIFMEKYRPILGSLRAENTPI